MGNITIQGDLTGDVPGGEVGGASNLTTVGAIPYVSAAGILNQDPTALFWDAANDRLGVGTNSPQAGLWVAGGAGFVNYSGTSNLFVIANPNSQSNINFQDGTSGFGTNRGSIVYYSSSNSTSPNLMSIASSGPISFSASTSERARFAATTGNLLIGTTTDSNFKLDVAASGSAGTARFYGGSGVSASTKVVVQAGGGQSGNLQEWQAFDGSINGYVSSQFLLSIPYGEFQGYIVGGTGANAFQITDDGIKTKSAFLTQWTNGTRTGTADLSLSRASAGVLQVGDGGSNANGYIGFGNGAGIIGTANSLGLIYTAGQIEFRSPAAARLMTLGGTGTISIYNETSPTGVTRAVIRAGAGQSTTNLTEWQNSGGTVIASVGSSGSISIAGSLAATGGSTIFGTAGSYTGIYGAGGLSLLYFDGSAVARALTWNSSGVVLFGNTLDAGIARNSAGVLEINNGTAGTYRDLILRRSQHNGVTVAALPAAAAGNAGSIQYVTDANATTIGSTVAGGGANKVMVWSDGAAWKIFAS